MSKSLTMLGSGQACVVGVLHPILYRPIKRLLPTQPSLCVGPVGSSRFLHSWTGHLWIC